MAMPIHLLDEQATAAFAARLAERLRPPCLLFLQGQLGTGKTSFARGFVRAKGYHGVVRSPTYTLMELYPLADCTILHLDLYRLGDVRELEELGVRDFLSQDTYCLVEWPERAGRYLGTPDLVLHFAYAEPGRSVVVEPDIDL